MAQPKVLSAEEEAESTGPMAQILWLHKGQWFDAQDPVPSSSLPVSPPGWYVDRLRYWNGRHWTEEWRPISEPRPPAGRLDERAWPLRSPLVAVAGKSESLAGETEPFAGETEPLAGGPEPFAGGPESFVATVVGLLGLPPPLAPASPGGPAEDRSDDLTPRAQRVGLLGMPPPLSPVATAAGHGARRRWWWWRRGLG